MKPFLDRINHGEVLLADGAMGTLLMRRGLPSGACPEAWNLEHPDALQEIAGLYLEAGAEIIHTNTFGGSPLKLAHYDLDAETEAINRAAVQAVRRAVGDRGYVSASCGPTGKLRLPFGDTEPAAIKAAFERQIRALVGAGTDLICVETMTDLEEAKLAITTAKSLAPSTPVMATMTFDPTPRGFFTVMGTTIDQAAAGLEQAGADVIGANCGHGTETMLEVARAYRKATRLPLMIQSNAGLPTIIDGELVYPETPEIMARRATEMVAEGVAVIGGCCGTTPDHIRAMRAALDGLAQR